MNNQNKNFSKEKRNITKVSRKAIKENTRNFNVSCTYLPIF